MFVSQGLGGPKGNASSSYSKGIQVNIPVQQRFFGDIFVLFLTLCDRLCRIVVLFKYLKLRENCNSENLVYLWWVILFWMIMVDSWSPWKESNIGVVSVPRSDTGAPSFVDLGVLG